MNKKTVTQLVAIAAVAMFLLTSFSVIMAQNTISLSAQPNEA